MLLRKRTNDREGMTTSARTNSRFEELDHREIGGIDVALLWNRADDSLSVMVVDTKTDEQLELRVEGHEAMDVFRHPFAYASSHRVDRQVSQVRAT